MSKAWLTADTQNIAITDQDKVHICDDCPCSSCGAFATTYTAVRSGGASPDATALLTLNSICLCAPCSNGGVDYLCYWDGEFHQSPDFGYEGRVGQLWFRHTDQRWVLRVYDGPYPICGAFFSEFIQTVPDYNTIPGSYGTTMTIT